MSRRDLKKNSIVSVITMGLLTTSFSTAYGAPSKTIKTAKVAEAYSCPLFENRPHSELIAAIDSLSKEVNSTPGCNNNPSAKSFGENGQVIKESILSLQKAMSAQNSTQVNQAEIDQTITNALGAVGNIGSVINNNTFLNSHCGRQVMSTGKVLLAVNDVINGLAPYALFAVSMNAALAPALPFVIGGVVATSGISAINKMIEENTLDMTNPEHRKALLQNTCQYTKIAKKVRFMQLAQSGRIEEVSKELENSIAFYNSNFSKPSAELNSLLALKNSTEKSFAKYSADIEKDKQSFEMIETQLKLNTDPIMTCSIATELATTAQVNNEFPGSVFANLQALSQQGSQAERIQGSALLTLNMSSLKNIEKYSKDALTNEQYLNACARTGKTWIQGIKQALLASEAMLDKRKNELDSHLNSSSAFRQWKQQYTLVENDKQLIKRVEKAMKELSKDNSIIDRSELAQRMVNLKSGLFGNRGEWTLGKPPVLAWILHTKSMHDQAISSLSRDMKALREGSLSLTEAGKRLAAKPKLGPFPLEGLDTMDIIYLGRDAKLTKKLSNFTLKELPVGSRENEIVCQQLESAWLDWSASLDHLGAIQFFCDMIDPVLDVKMDKSVIKACRGNSPLGTQDGYEKSIVEKARITLREKGFQKEAQLVSAKMKELQCPMPSVSVMQ